MSCQILYTQITPCNALIYLLITSNNCPMPWLFLVAVIRPLSMSFSFDASGKVYLAAYLAFILISFCFPPCCGCSSAPPACTHIRRTASAHRTHISLSCFGGWWSFAVVCGRDDMVMRDTGQQEDRDEWQIDRRSGRTRFSITVQRQSCGQWSELRTLSVFWQQFGVLSNCHMAAVCRCLIWKIYYHTFLFRMKISTLILLEIISIIKITIISDMIDWLRSFQGCSWLKIFGAWSKPPVKSIKC